MIDRKTYFAAAARGTEAALIQELSRLGIDGAKGRGGVSFVGNLEDAYRVCLWSHVATRVVLPLGESSIESADDLYAWMHGIHWEDHLRADHHFLVTISGSHSAFRNTHFAVQRAKDAVVDRFRERTGTRPTVDRGAAETRIALALGEPCHIGVELAGHMHRRGYRGGAAAPLRESLAAALLEEASFDGSQVVIDPFCGSGTILLEAALRIAGMAPGLLRLHHGFEAWLGHNAEMWQALQEHARSQRKIPNEVQLFGFDISSKALAAAQDSATQLGLTNLISWSVASVEQTEPPALVGDRDVLLISNPPYGIRVGEERELIPLYEQLGNTLKRRYAGATAWLLVGNPSLSQHLGLRTKQKAVLFNGPIECRLLQIPLYTGSQKKKGQRGLSAPPGKRVSERAKAPATKRGRPLQPDTQMFRNRLRKNLKRLKPWATKEELDAYRLYDAEIPEFNLTVDRYGARVRVEEYAPPPSIPRRTADRRLKEALEVVGDELSVPQEDVVLRVRTRDENSGRVHPHLATGRTRSVVREGQFQFEVDLESYLDTGLFLQDRKLRSFLAKNTENKRVLNLFSYTCAASVAAAVGGAEHVTSVDLSKTYLAWGKENFQRNNLDPQLHRFVNSDVLRWLERAGPQGRHFDVVYCGPPTTSRSRRASPFDLVADHPQLIHQTMRVMDRDGFLVFFTHVADFTLGRLPLPYEVEDLTKQFQPSDLRKGATVFRIRHPNKKRHE